MDSNENIGKNLERKHKAIMQKYDAKILEAEAIILHNEYKKKKWERSLVEAEEKLRDIENNLSKEKMTICDTYGLLVSKSRFKMYLYASRVEKAKGKKEELIADRNLYQIHNRLSMKLDKE